MTEHYPSAYPSPMGRYDVGEVAPGTRLYPIRMLGVPVELFLSTRQQHDELMREFAMLALAHRDQLGSDPPELRRLVGELASIPPSGSRADANVEAASQAGQASIDLAYRVPITVLAAADRLEALMQSADVFCREGRDARPCPGPPADAALLRLVDRGVAPPGRGFRAYAVERDRPRVVGPHARSVPELESG